MNKTRFGTSLVLVLGLFGLASGTHGAGQYLKIDYPASTATNELQVAVTYTLWIPDGVKTIRGIIVHQHGAGTTASIEGCPRFSSRVNCQAHPICQRRNFICSPVTW